MNERPLPDIVRILHFNKAADLEAAINKKLEAIAPTDSKYVVHSMQYQIQAGGYHTCLIRFTPKTNRKATVGKRKSAVDSRTEFVEETVTVEKLLLACLNTRKLTVDQRKIITKVAPTEEEAKNLQLFYRANSKAPLDEQARLGMKRSFETLINQLSNQIDIAGEWVRKNLKQSELIEEPDWIWQETAKFLAEKDKRYEVEDWHDLPYNCKKYVLRMGKP